MIIFRPHRGTLADALAEVKEFNSVEAMKEYILKDWTDWFAKFGREDKPFQLEDIIIDEQSIDDERCGWHDCRYVCLKRLGKEIYNVPQCVGMCATDYKK